MEYNEDGIWSGRPAGRIIVMTLQEMRERKKERGLTNEMIAGRSGVPLGTVQKIFAGITKITPVGHHAGAGARAEPCA